VTMLFRYIVLSILTGSLLTWMVVFLSEQGIVTSSTGISLKDSKADTNTITIEIGKSYDALPLIRKQGFVVVGKVDSNSISKKAGIQVGDTIATVDGTGLKDKPQLIYKLRRESRSGDKDVISSCPVRL